MPLDRDTEREIVIRLNWGFRVFGWTLILWGIGLIAGGLIGATVGYDTESGSDTVANRIGVGLVLGGVGVIFFLSGVYAASTTTKITFDQARGHMTMRWRTWVRRWPPFTRTKQISVEEVARAHIRSERGKDSQGRPRNTYQVWLEMKSGEKVTLLRYYPDDRKVAERLQERILELCPAAVPR